MIFRPNHFKNIAILAIILVLPIVQSFLLPDVDMRIVFGIPTLLILVYLMKIRTKLQYEIEKDKLILISSKRRVIIPIHEIQSIHLHQMKLLPISQYFVILENAKYEVAQDLLNEEGDSVVDVLIKTYNINVEKKNGIKMTY